MCCTYVALLLMVNNSIARMSVCAERKQDLLTYCLCLFVCVQITSLPASIGEVRYCHCYCVYLQTLHPCFMFRSVSLWETHSRALEYHLPYGITPCYLPPDTGERTRFNPSQTGRYSMYLPHVDGWLSWPWCWCGLNGLPVCR